MNNANPNHVLLYEKQIQDEGIVVLNGINQLPFYEAEYKLPHFAIVLVHNGTLLMRYDTENSLTFADHDVAFVYPNHSFVPLSVSQDYNATVIIMSDAMFENQGNHHVRINRIIYESSPSFHLDDSHYDIIVNAINVLDGLCKISSESKNELKVVMLNVIIKILDIYRTDSGKMPNMTNRSVSSMFYSALEKHCATERSVDFYAQFVSLSPKHFSRVIAKETGHPAGYWIRKSVVDKAKTMIRNEYNIPLQEISDRLNFPDQASFCRYFKRETDITPSEYRWKMQR